jgi:aspartyl-tRNA(Asn)/glutamyl-tRNA(Gln) amidotransferase subunit B
VVFEALLLADDHPLTIAEKHSILLMNDDGALEKIIDDVMFAMPDKVIEYKSGKKGLMGLFVGETMKRSAGKADPKKVNELLNQKLND